MKHLAPLRPLSSVVAGLSLAALLGSSVDAGSFRQEAARHDYLIHGSPGPATVHESADGHELILENGLVRRTWRLEPNLACIGLEELRGERQLLRAVEPEARLVIDGEAMTLGGLIGQPNRAFLTEPWIDAMQADPAALPFVGYESGPIQEWFPWKRVRHHASGAAWPPAGVHLRFDFAPADASLLISVHYELYDGIPVFAKWVEVRNKSAKTITVDRFTAEILAIVEDESRVETRAGAPFPPPTSLHVETDFAFGGMTAANANRHAVHWRVDPHYTTQVNYLLQTPCLLVVEPTFGPAQDVTPGATFETFRVFELLHDSADRERRGLAQRRMYRTIAPWVTENPLMHHMRISDPDAVRRAIDMAAEVGFEMIILSFGSGFNIESEDPAYIATWRELADYARQKDIEIGGYSLLSSRRIGGGNDIVPPEGVPLTHGACPALTSEWGLAYMAKLRSFFEATGFRLLEHDGPYPGDVDTTPRPPHQKGEQDSRWVQWRITRDFYRWCRSRGIYLNTPDYYYLAGSTKCGMGYREVNWSLPRAQQVIHTRQNIFDGTWTKTPSMGWMFVPLTEYHGGGAAATIAPLDQHREHYGRMLDSNLALGVQACYRGPELFDTPATRELVAGRVAWFKRYRSILEADLIHGRRADGRSLDWMLHVAPGAELPGMLLVFNPTDRTITREIEVDLYYTGLTRHALIARGDENPEQVPLARDYTARIQVEVPAGGMAWHTIRGE